MTISRIEDYISKQGKWKLESSKRKWQALKQQRGKGMEHCPQGGLWGLESSQELSG